VPGEASRGKMKRLSLFSSASDSDLVTVAVALYDFNGLRADNLQFKKGDLVTVLEMEESGWWKGCNSDGKVGIFPYNYVELHDDIGSFLIVEALYNFEAQSSDQLSFKKGDEFTLLKEMSVDWWYGQKSDGSEGVFPANRVKKTEEVNHVLARAEKERWSLIKKEKKKELKLAAKEREALKLQQIKQKDEEEKARLAKEAREAEERAKKAEEELAALRAEASLFKRQKEQEKSSNSKSARDSVARQRLAIKNQARKSSTRWQGMAPGPPPELEKEKAKYLKEKNADDDLFGPAPPLNTDEILAPTKQPSKVVSEPDDESVPDAESVKSEAPPPRVFQYNSKFANLGGGSTCRKCGKSVGFADKIKALGGEWHKDCFRCSTCSVVLRQGEWREHNKFPYCHKCHAAGFGMKGFGFGGSLAPNVETGRSGAARKATSELDESSVFETLKE